MNRLRPQDVTLAVIAKAPVPGRVKTRLCPPCTPTQAAQLAEAALRDTLAAVRGATSGTKVLVLDGSPGTWVPEGVQVIAQRGDGLDRRLAAACEDIAAPVVILGMDTPQVDQSQLERTIAALCGEGADAVVAPATDGGYWAIGLRRSDPGAFLGVPMSRADTGRAQVRRLRGLGLSVATGELLRDVDTFADALAVAREVPGSRFAAAVRDLPVALSAGGRR